MNYQDFIISPDVLQRINKAFLSESYEPLDLRSYLYNLDLKRLVTCQEIDSEYHNIVKDSTDSGKKSIEAILRKFESPDKFLRVDSKTFSNHAKETIHNNLLNLSIHSESKIVNSEDFRLKLFQTKEGFKELEVLNMEETIKPPDKSKIFCYERTIIFKKTNRFPFESYLRYYLTETKHLLVYDIYVRNAVNFTNLIKIIGLCKKLEKLSIITDTNKVLYKSVEEVEKEIKTKFSYIKEIDIRSEIWHNRKLITDEFEILIEPDLGFVDDKYICRKYDVIIHIRKLQK